MYPWPDPSSDDYEPVAGGPHYPVTDLLDEIVFNGVTLNRLLVTTNGYDYCFSDGDGVLTGEWFVAATYGEEGFPFWTGSPGPDSMSTSQYYSDCLIATWGGVDIVTGDPVLPVSVTDTFPNTLTVNGTDAITRDPTSNPCVWSGGLWTLLYNATTYKFELNGVAKSGDQDSPIGSYSGDVVS